MGTIAKPKQRIVSPKVKEGINNAVLAIKENSSRFSQNFSESKFWEKIKTVGKKAGIGLLYPVYLLYNAMVSPLASVKDKAIIIGSLGYFILPADFVPDVLPGIGYADDAAAIAACLAAISSILKPEMHIRTKEQLKKVFGEIDEEMLEKVRRSTEKGLNEASSL